MSDLKLRGFITGTFCGNNLNSWELPLKRQQHQIQFGEINQYHTGKK
jgi:hypothetical protein